jgi:hypothetical protein
VQRSEFKPPVPPKKKVGAGHGGAHLQSQHSQGLGKKMANLRAAWYIQQDHVSKKKKEKKKVVIF